jgi:hypothetical protein
VNSVKVFLQFTVTAERQNVVLECGDSVLNGFTRGACGSSIAASSSLPIASFKRTTYLLILSVVCSAVKGVFTVALYRYASQRQAPPGFSADLIDDALGGR